MRSAFAFSFTTTTHICCGQIVRLRVPNPNLGTGSRERTGEKNVRRRTQPPYLATGLAACDIVESIDGSLPGVPRGSTSRENRIEPSRPLADCRAAPVPRHGGHGY